MRGPEAIEIEERERTLRSGAVRSCGRIVEPDARVPAGLNDLRHGEVMRMIRLQMSRDEAGAALERVERHARLDAGTHYATAHGHTVIAVQRAK